MLKVRPVDSPSSPLFLFILAWCIVRETLLGYLSCLYSETLAGGSSRVPISLYLTTLAEASSCDGVLVILSRLLESNASLRRLGGQDSPLLLVE